VLATCSLLIAFYPSFWPVISAQVLIGGTSSVFNPAICAISLGIVGHKLFDTRQGRNQMFNSAGNVIAAISMGIIGYYISNRDIFFFVAILSIPTMLSILLINPGRKPLLLIAFGVLPIRGILYTLTNNTELLVAIQVLDGVGAGIFGVVSVLVIADLTEGTGRFNLTLGAISTAVGIGASLSQVIAGSIVKSFGYSTGFVFLATIALAAFIILYCFMPETKTKTI
jgi:predicted MFS family arabinose efflux permease